MQCMKVNTRSTYARRVKSPRSNRKDRRAICSLWEDAGVLPKDDGLVLYWLAEKIDGFSGTGKSDHVENGEEEGKPWSEEWWWWWWWSAGRQVQDCWRGLIRWVMPWSTDQTKEEKMGWWYLPVAAKSAVEDDPLHGDGGCWLCWYVAAID